MHQLRRCLINWRKILTKFLPSPLYARGESIKPAQRSWSRKQSTPSQNNGTLRRQTTPEVRRICEPLRKCTSNSNKKRCSGSANATRTKNSSRKSCRSRSEVQFIPRWRYLRVFSVALLQKCRLQMKMQVRIPIKLFRALLLWPHRIVMQICTLYHRDNGLVLTK